MCFASDSIACFAKFSGYGTVRVSCFNNHQATNTIHHTACISINKALILTEFSTACPAKTNTGMACFHIIKLEMRDPVPIVIESNEYGDPVVVSVSVFTILFTRKSVAVDARHPFPPDLVVCFSSPVLYRHKWNAQGIFHLNICICDQHGE
jgi:hypothetical protein